MSHVEQVELQLVEWVLQGHALFHVIHCPICRKVGYIATARWPGGSLAFSLTCDHHWGSQIMCSADDILALIKPQ